MQLLPSTLSCGLFTISLSQWILVSFCFPASQPRPVPFWYEIENSLVHCFSRWFEFMFHSRQDPQLLFRVSGYLKGRSILLVNVRGSYFSIYMWNDFCLPSFTFLVPPWNWAHPVFEEPVERSKRTPHRRPKPMVQSTQKDELNETILVWNVFFTASVTFEVRILWTWVPRFEDNGRVWLLAGVAGKPGYRRLLTVAKATGLELSYDSDVRFQTGTTG